jgi:hypothetical protein
MAETKKDPAAVAEGAQGTERSTNVDQALTGPAGTGEEDPNATQTYYLREGKVHHVILKGESRELNRFGQETELTASQYGAFKDKFLTKAEYAAIKAGKDATSEGANAAAPLDGRTSENPTPEERNAENNEGAGKQNATGEKAKA